MSLAGTIVANNKSSTGDHEHRPKGRPKSGRMGERYVVMASPEHKTWMDEFKDFIGEPDSTRVIRDALKSYAESKNFRSPPAR